MAMLCVCENNRESIPPSMSKQPDTIGAVSTIPTKKKEQQPEPEFLYKTSPTSFIQYQFQTAQLFLFLPTFWSPM
ncbi:hypothetical protein LOK49_LG09G02028 [Camellia lanceoleosa]|uniref:Uncharacterized protein n=1 Tax=Camellia lanceoleosa TaxID=1840588 RepID=A0ACC0GGS9_9ERIC|nr:hypothetical protein LOK49_LG09G02028 [Camellia lanceoleosa]